MPDGIQIYQSTQRSVTAIADKAVSWRRSPGLLAWPHGWQRPARTEEWAFEESAAALGHCPFSQLVCFPWAPLIDLLARGHLNRAKTFTEALTHAPPRTNLIRATVCQHIRVDAILPWLRSLGITDLFWSHARTDQAKLEGIRVHAFPLYPVRALDRTVPLAGTERPAVHRRYLYSFVGAYSAEGYLTSVRQWIFDLPRRSDAHIVRRNEWHYESTVYGEQIGRQTTPLKVRARLEHDGEEFDAVLLDSIFSLCPSGSGPNTIRLWESLGFGCIPVLLSDALRLPGRTEEWDGAIVRVPETPDAIAELPRRLEAILRDPIRLQQMQRAGRRLWLRYGVDGAATVLSALSNRDWVRAQMESN